MTGALLVASPSGVGLGSILGHDFMRSAFLAGIPIAALAGVVGYFMVLRGQVFTGDALSHAAFTGALAALAAGLDARLGLFVATVAIAALLGVLGRERADDVVIGTIFAWVMGLGVLALSLYAASPEAAANGAAGVNVLFGSIFGIDSGDARTAAVVGVVLLLLVVALARPLLFASIDVDVAAVRGVPVRALGLVFLVVVGATAAEATQAVGALLLLGLLSAPAGAAQRLTDRPYRAMALSATLSVASMVVGLTAAYLVPEVPPSFGILAVASGLYAATFLFRPRHRRPRAPRQPSASPAGA
jgi:zinc/manganese transport system permease protein